jgi:hypothetical protein
MKHPLRPAIRRALRGRRLTTEEIHHLLTARDLRVPLGAVAGELGRMLADGVVAVRPVGNDAIWKL